MNHITLWVLGGLTLIGATIPKLFICHKIQPPCHNEFIELRNPVGFTYVGWCNYLMFAAFAYGSSVTIENNSWLPTSGFLLFSLLGAYIIIWTVRNRLLYSDILLFYTPLVGRDIEFNWKDLINISWKPFLREWHIALKSGKSVRVNPQMPGIANFLEELHQNKSDEINDSLEQELDIWKRGRRI